MYTIKSKINIIVLLMVAVFGMTASSLVVSGRVASAAPSLDQIKKCYAAYNGHGNGQGSDNKLNTSAYAASNCDSSKGGPCKANGSSQGVAISCTPVPPSGSRISLVVSGPDTFSASGDRIALNFTVLNAGQNKLSGIKVTTSPSLTVKCSGGSAVAAQSVSCTAAYTAARKDYQLKKIVIKSTVKAKGSDGKVVSASKTNTITRTANTRDSAVVAGRIDGDSLPQVGADQGTINKLLNIFFGILTGIALLVITVGGLRYILANGDSGAIVAAKNTILYALIGLMVAILGYAIVNFVLRGLS